MVNLTRIYTRTGDAGETRLGDMSLTSKTDLRLQAYADVDEANAHIGVALAIGGLEDDVVAVLTHGAERPLRRGRRLLHAGRRPNPEYPPLRIEQDYVDRLEAWCDQYNEDLPKLRSFILNGGTPGAAHLHVARTVVRRAERSGLGGVRGARRLDERAGRSSYLNRLSDLLFILARHANREHGDVLWVPGGDRAEPRRDPPLAAALSRRPGGAASSQARNPVSASGLIATSSSPAGVRQVTTMWPEYSEYASTPSASRRPTYSRSERE